MTFMARNSEGKKELRPMYLGTPTEDEEQEIMLLKSKTLIQALSKCGMELNAEGVVRVIGKINAEAAERLENSQLLIADWLFCFLELYCPELHSHPLRAEAKRFPLAVCL